MTHSSRELILARIRAGLSTISELGDKKALDTGWAHGLAGEVSGQRVDSEKGPLEVRSLFMDRVSEYRAEVSQIPAASLPEAIASSLANRGVRRLAVPQGMPSDWLLSAKGNELEILTDGESHRVLSKGQLASVHGVLTGCSLGIAETGTIVLDAGPAQGRRALSLLPDYHLCVVFGSQVVETVPEAVAALAAGFASHRRPITLISGPSATSDIELIRVEGVHGPRNLEVLLVEDDG